MKKLLPLMLIFSLALFFACDTDGGSTDPDSGITEPDGGTTDPDNGGNLVLTTSILLKDASGATLGYVLSASPHDDIEVLTPNGYICSISWDGEVCRSVQFTGQDGTGTAVRLGDINYPIYGKAVYIANGSLYIPQSLDSDNNVIFDATITESQSIWAIWKNDFDNGGYTANAVEKFYVLRIATAAEVGLPATITTPISLVPEQ